MQLKSKEFRIEVTSRCNAHCTICPREKMTRPLVTMDTAHFKYVVSQAHALDVQTISLFGHGEPLLDPGLVDKLRYCSEAQFETFITTNASMLSPDASYELLNAGLSHIRFSAHGFGENYNKVHKGLDWNRFAENVGHFMRMRHDLNSRCVISVSVIPMNDERISDIRRFWEPNCDFLEIWRPHNWTDGRSYRGIKVCQRKKTCGRPHSGPVQIQADGKMIVCCFDFDGKMIVGDTHKNTVEEILQCDEFDRIRRKHETGDHSGLLCATCDQLNIDQSSPLLYSNRDDKMEAGRLSSTKIKLKEN
jgi:hypothetical protein